jgi:D-beta-D-heptose 7-phosphate kinase/D-beta-D-heptose 1-phosphate adenosyltransferase
MSGGGQLLACLDRIAGGRVVVAGDAMLDRYVEGTVERISPEAPVPVLRVGETRTMPGGAGNVARNLVAVGARAHLAAVRGDDAAGAALAAALALLPGVTLDLLVDPARPTTEKTRYLAQGQQLLRADRERRAPPDAGIAAALVDAVRAALADATALVLSDYAKGALSGGIAERLIGLAADRALPVIVDPKGGDFARYRGARLITPNRRELAVAAGREIGPGDEAAAARAVLAASGVAAAVVTLGADGMLVVTQAGDTMRLAAEAREVFDVSGAGDTVCAMLAAGLGAGLGLAEAARLANAAAGLVVGKVGTAVATAEEIARALLAADRARLDAKVLPLARLVDRLDGWRREGLRIGFTNGCFDLLHPGHVSLLAQARAACDRLVVGLNTDASVSDLKGPGRPVQGEAARALVLAALADVDAVVLFAEPTPLRLIEAIRPDVLVKGRDYRREDVVGALFVEGYGGRVLLAELTPGYSTSATVGRLGR